jgi:hypothetical protein
MGLFGFFRGKDERAIPEPGTPEWDAAVSGTALPGSVEMGDVGWTDPTEAEAQGSGAQTIDLRGTEAKENVEEVLRKHGIDPEKEGQKIDAGTVPGLQKAILGALGMSGLQIPNAEGFGGGISPPKVDPVAQVEYLAAKRDAGEITEAEFEAQKRQILGS